MSCDSCNDADIDVSPCDDCQDGKYGGYCLKWKFDGATGSGPASQYLRLNNGTYSSATVLYVNDTSSDSVAAQAYLDTFDDTGTSANYGYITISKEFDSSVFVMFKVTAVVDSGTYHTITVTYITGAGSFSQNDNLTLCFTPTGIQGTTGSSGPALPLTTGFVTASSANQNLGAVTGSDVIISGLTFSISTAGTYRFWYEGTVYNDTATHSGYYGIYVNTVQSSGTQRNFGTATASLSGIKYKTGVNQDIVISGASTVDVRFRVSVAANTIHETGTFCYIRIA